ncbi:LacI family DNA-binding transcriptional regulator [Ruania alkalisoli]|uniref:Transcriptional regulator, LacI family n=3 Tax=Ruaniaceae TaxID=1331736 RepID=A0A1H5M9A5_9MICO|nr:LacI family DNA-binding transcriptional regulator [Ruania alkalisoli]SEE85862.1 transcriptional regulator, LacI family [Ruania alba]
MKEVARSAGVSVGTVSNVLNRPDYVSEDNRVRVLEAINRLGYVRNNAARQLRVGRTRTVGLVVLNVANPYFTDVMRGVEDTLSRAGMSVILCNSNGQHDREEANLRMLAEQQVQGLLISPIDADNPALRELISDDLPAVFLGSSAGPIDRCSVSVDDVTGGNLAARHLLNQGHERLMYVHGPLEIGQVRARREGIVAALEAAGVPAGNLASMACPDLTLAAGRDAGERLLGAPERPQAVICANDLLALGMLQAMFAAGVAVPDELALVGYDDIEFAAGSAVPLSSVRQPRYELGRRGAELLLAEIDGSGDHDHQEVVMTPELVVRGSSNRRGR